MAMNPGFFVKLPTHIWAAIPPSAFREYCWFIANTTSEERQEDGSYRGIVNNGHAVTYLVIAKDIGTYWKGVQRHVEELVEAGWVARTRQNRYSPYSYVVTDSYKLNNREEALRLPDSPEIAEWKHKKKAAQAKLKNGSVPKVDDEPRNAFTLDEEEFPTVKSAVVLEVGIDTL